MLPFKGNGQRHQNWDKWPREMREELPDVGFSASAVTEAVRKLRSMTESEPEVEEPETNELPQPMDHWTEEMKESFTKMVTYLFS